MSSEEPAITSDYPLPPKYYLSDNLVPPAPPSDGIYTVFGEQRKLEEVTPLLEDQELETLFDPKAKRKDEVRRLLGLAQERYLGLVEKLSQNAEQSVLEQKVKDLDLCFINIMYLSLIHI